MSDERMRRGLAVQRRMQEIAARGARQAPDYARGLAALAERYPRGIPPSDAQAYLSVRARFGVEAAMQWLSDSGFTADEAFAVGALDHRGGPDAIGAAVQAEAVAQAQGAAEQDAVAALEGLRPQDWQAAQQLLAADPSGQRLAQEAVRLGLPPHVAVAAVRTIAAQGGVEQTRQAVAEQAQARARADALRAAGEKDRAAVQGDASWDPLASQEVHRAALNLLTQYGPALTAAGVGVKDGESPVAWLRRIAATGDEATIAKVATASGEGAEAIRSVVIATRTAEDHREVRSRIRASDDAMRKAKAIPVPKEQEWTPHKAPRSGLDEAMEKAKARLGVTGNEGDRKPIRAEGVTDAAVAIAAGRDFRLTAAGRKAAAQAVERRRPPTTGLDAAMGRAVRHLESGGTPEDARAAVEASEDARTDAAIDAAIDQDGGSTDA